MGPWKLEFKEKEKKEWQDFIPDSEVERMLPLRPRPKLSLRIKYKDEVVFQFNNYPDDDMHGMWMVKLLTDGLGDPEWPLERFVNDANRGATDGTTEPGPSVHGDGTLSIYPEYLFP